MDNTNSSKVTIVDGPSLRNVARRLGSADTMVASMPRLTVDAADVDSAWLRACSDALLAVGSARLSVGDRDGAADCWGLASAFRVATMSDAQKAVYDA